MVALKLGKLPNTLYIFKRNIVKYYIFFSDFASFHCIWPIESIEHEFGQTLRDSEGWGGGDTLWFLGRKESDMN